jgi:DNA-binding transcriptional LysR family regulator
MYHLFMLFDYNRDRESDMFKLRHLAAMRAVVAGRTITRAAEIFGVTQPAMSRLIAGLEDEAGLKLFARRGHQLTLTGDGETFFGAAQRVFDATENLTEVAEKVRAGNYGLLRITAQSALEFGLLPAAIEIFGRSHSNVSVVLNFRFRRNIENWLAASQFDLGLARMPIDDPSVRFEKFASLDVCVIAPKDHRFAALDVVTPSDFNGCTLISFARGTLLRYRTDELLSSAGVHVRSVETQSSGTAFHLVAAGVGVAIVHGLAGVLPDGPVVVRPLRPAIPFDYAIIWPAGNAPKGPAEAFARILRDLARTAAHPNPHVPAR